MTLTTLKRRLAALELSHAKATKQPQSFNTLMVLSWQHCACCLPILCEMFNMRGNRDADHEIIEYRGLIELCGGADNYERVLTRFLTLRSSITPPPQNWNNAEPDCWLQAYSETMDVTIEEARHRHEALDMATLEKVHSDPTAYHPTAVAIPVELMAWNPRG